MRYSQTIYKILGFVLIPVISAVAIAAHVAPEILGATWLGAAATILICVFALVGLIQFHLNSRRLDRHEIQNWADRVCQSENVTSTGEHSAESNDVFEQVERLIDLLRQRADRANHGRASAEVRIRRLTDQCNQMSEIVDGLADPVLAIDHYDELILANPIAQQLFDFEAHRTEKVAIDRLVHCEELVSLLTDTRKRTSPTQRIGEISISDDEGSARYFRVICRGIGGSTDIADSDGSSLQGAVAVLNDISNEKAIQKRNSEFVSSVSHEMKTPLAGIKAYVELLADGEAEDEATRDEFLEVIASQAERLQRLIDNLLNLARIEAGVVSVSKQKTSLNEILAKAIEVVQPSADAKDIALTTEFSPMYLGVHADYDMMMQAAINLLSNAIKYTPAGGAVTLRSRMSDLDLIFEVEDTGVGLSTEDQKNVFEKFYRVKKDKNMAPGTGLGLPLARHIVEDVHGGQLSLESELGRGSTFRVTLVSAQSPRWVGGAT